MVKRIFLVLFILLLLSPASAMAKPKAVAPVKSGLSYIEMDMITVPVITNRGLSQQFSFSVSLEVPAEKEEDVEKFKRRLTDAYIQDLYGALGAGYGFMQNGVINVTQVKHRLRDVTASVLSPASLEVNDVLLKVVQQYHF